MTDIKYVSLSVSIVTLVVGFVGTVLAVIIFAERFSYVPETTKRILEGQARAAAKVAPKLGKEKAERKTNDLEAIGKKVAQVFSAPGGIVEDAAVSGAAAGIAVYQLRQRKAVNYKE